MPPIWRHLAFVGGIIWRRKNCICLVGILWIGFAETENTVSSSLHMSMFSWHFVHPSVWNCCCFRVMEVKLFASALGKVPVAHRSESCWGPQKSTEINLCLPGANTAVRQTRWCFFLPRLYDLFYQDYMISQGWGSLEKCSTESKREVEMWRGRGRSL